MNTGRRTVRSLAWIVVFALASPSLAWDAAGHRAITLVALEGLPDSMPAWLKDRETQLQIADQSVVPDRWRGVKVAQLTHLNNPDHYLDVEYVEEYGLTLRTMPNLRHEFVKAMVLAKERAGPEFKGKPVNPARDLAKTDEWPGFLAHATLEQWGKVQSAFKTVRTLEGLNDPKRSSQLAMARANAATHMGVLSHFVGDTTQPLHTTKHHHGWVGDNPKGYSTEYKIHSYIDGGILRHHEIGPPAIRAGATFDRVVDANDPWGDVLSHIERSFAEVEPLYELKRSGELENAAGKVFIVSRLADAAGMLEALYQAAWEASAPTEKEIADFVRFDGFDPDVVAGEGAD